MEVLFALAGLPSLPPPLMCLQGRTATQGPAHQGPQIKHGQHPPSDSAQVSVGGDLSEVLLLTNVEGVVQGDLAEMQNRQTNMQNVHADGVLSVVANRGLMLDSPRGELAPHHHQTFWRFYCAKRSKWEYPPSPG